MAGAVGAFVLAFGVLPEAMSSAMARIFRPFADIAPATGVKFAVKPGNAKALRGEIQNFTGVSDPYEPPVSPDIHLRSDRETVDESRARILTWLETNGLISPA